MLSPILALAALVPQASPAPPAPEVLELRLRRLLPDADPLGAGGAIERVERWDAERTAVIVCDMWDRHWCSTATARVAELAPAVDRFLAVARQRGALVVHAPSDTMEFYADTPQRRRAREAVPLEPPVPIRGWCSLDPDREGALPIDDSDGGCDGEGTPARVWTRQIETITIAPEDVITDDGRELWTLFAERRIRHVFVLGVHTNMCVLGRSFAIRQLVALGLDVALVRDLTDTMYAPRSAPHVSHFRGTDAVVRHIERHWCPSVASTDVTGAPPFRFAADVRPRIALVTAEDEYEAAHTLPAFAHEALARRFGFEPVHLDAAEGVPDLASIADADLVVLFVRRRSLSPDQRARVEAHLDAGKPLVALRTSSHAFDEWPEFDAEVLGGSYSGHHGNRGPDAPVTQVRALPEAAGHAILRGLPPGPFPVRSWLYRTSPLAADVTPLLEGRVGDAPPEPVAWTRRFGAARVFYTSLGHPADFELEPFRRLLVNAVHWSLDLPEPWWPPRRAAVVIEPRPDWSTMTVPGPWESPGSPLERGYDGLAWYRCAVELPAAWEGREVVLTMGPIDNCDETFLNSARVGGTGAFPPHFENAAHLPRRYVLPPELVRAGSLNRLAIRVYDEGGAGGFRGAGPVLTCGADALALDGLWAFRLGDDPTWREDDAGR